jgi:dihydrofolate reductase
MKPDMSTSLSIICGMDRNRLIGQNNALPWHLPADMAFFKQTTMGKPILMGRKTWDSIGRPLPGRRNIVISRNPDFKLDGTETATSIEAALELVREHPEAMLMGGSSLYEQTMNIADTLYITEINHVFEGDAWFPEIDPDIWKETSREQHQADEKNKFDYAFVKYLRR